MEKNISFDQDLLEQLKSLANEVSRTLRMGFLA